MWRDGGAHVNSQHIYVLTVPASAYATTNGGEAR